jgi:hypothetical protein
MIGMLFFRDPFLFDLRAFLGCRHGSRADYFSQALIGRRLARERQLRLKRFVEGKHLQPEVSAARKRSG